MSSIVAEDLLENSYLKIFYIRVCISDKQESYIPLTFNILKIHLSVN